MFCDALDLGDLILRTPKMCLVEGNYSIVLVDALNWLVTKRWQKWRIGCVRFVRPPT
jgi:hypothetical protein